MRTTEGETVRTAYPQQRKLALSSEEWTVEAGGTQRADKAAADFIKEQLDHILFDRLTEKMLSGLFWGYAVSECLWARDGQFIALANVKVKKQRRFGFAPDGSLRLLTSRAPQGEALPACKFWAYATGADDDDDPWREVEAPEDLKARADRDKVIFDMGYKPTLQYAKDTYGGEFEAKPDTMPPRMTR